MIKQLKVKKIKPDAVLPARATQASAGYDLCACIQQPLELPARGSTVVPTGIAIEMEGAGPGVAAFVFGRSGLGIKHGIVPSNGVGVIDADYRGEILVGLTNHSDRDYEIQPGERIAQMVLMPVFLPPVQACETLGETVRGGDGFGSTGR